MSDTNALRERIAGVFADALHLDVPSADTDLFETGVLDSLAFVELLLQLEHEFGVTTSVDDLGARELPVDCAHRRVRRLAGRHGGADCADRVNAGPKRPGLLPLCASASFAPSRPRFKETSNA